MKSIQTYAGEYVTALQNLVGRVEASCAGRAVSFEQGVEEVVQRIRRMMDDGGKIMLIGNGASAAMASHQAADFLRAASVRACAFNDAPLLTCLGNDFGFERTFDYSIGLMAAPADLLFCISSSGVSQNILNGARQAKETGCGVVTLSGFEPDNPLRALGEVSFFVPSHSYGKVEVIHLSILHCVNDYLAGR